MIRYVDETCHGDASWQLEALVDGEWRIVNAGDPSRPVGGRFPAGATAYRVVDAYLNGSVVTGEPVALSDASLGPVRRKFSRTDLAWLEANGVDPRLAATFPRGWSLADIRDALAES